MAPRLETIPGQSRGPASKSNNANHNRYGDSQNRHEATVSAPSTPELTEFAESLIPAQERRKLPEADWLLSGRI
jgi:hypothetical protein